MKLSLIVSTPGKMQGKEIPIPVAEFVIGRDPKCHLRPSSALISKRHCGLTQRDGRVFIKDFNSTNGTQVNGEPAEADVEVELHDGDRLDVGPLTFEVKIKGAVSVDTPTPRPPLRERT